MIELEKKIGLEIPISDPNPPYFLNLQLFYLYKLLFLLDILHLIKYFYFILPILFSLFPTDEVDTSGTSFDSVFIKFIGKIPIKLGVSILIN